MIGFCRRYWRGEKTEGAVISPTGVSLLLMQTEAMRTLTVLEVRRERSMAEQPVQGGAVFHWLGRRREGSVLYIEGKESECDSDTEMRFGSS